MKHATRGAALPETALVLSATLVMIFGIIQVSIIGFLQVMCDGAAFIAAHEYALGNMSTYQTFAQRPFPLAGSPVVAVNTPDPMATSTPFVAYTTGAGGASLIRPYHSQATVHIAAPQGLLGVGVAGLSNIDVHGSAIEPLNELTNPSYDIGGAGYAGAGDPTSFFSSNQNTPMYYVSSHRLLICQTTTKTLTYGSGSQTYTVPSLASFGTTCPASNQIVESLGTAEFLDRDNWNRVFYNALGQDYHGVLYTFPEMVCHQKYYAEAAQFFNYNTPQSQSAINANNAISTIYSWDVAFPYYSGVNTGSAAWGQYQLQPYLPEPAASC